MEHVEVLHVQSAVVLFHCFLMYMQEYAKSHTRTKTFSQPEARSRSSMQVLHYGHSTLDGVARWRRLLHVATSNEML